MSALAHNEDRLHVGKLRLEYSICGDQTKAQTVRTRVDRLVENTLRGHLQGLFEPLRPAGDGLWFIRRLELDADIDLELDDRDIMRNWSRRFARALQHYLLDERSGDVIYFPDYPSYLARFVADLASGLAASAWYYQTPAAEFAGLRALPAPQAIVTALLRDAAIGLQALLSLSSPDRARVLNAVSDQGARRLLHGLADSRKSTVADAGRLSITLLEQLQQPAAVPLLVSEQPWLETLELYLRVVEHQPSLAGHALAELTLATVTLRGLVLTHNQRHYQSILQSIRQGNIAGLFQRLSPDVAQRLQPLINLGPVIKRSLLEAVQPQTHPADQTESTGEPRYTRFGGVFLLLPMLQQLPLEQWLSDWPEPPAGDAAAVARLLLLAQCLGSTQAGQVWRDPVVRDVAGVPPALTADDVHAWLKRLPASAIRTVQKQYMGWRLAASDTGETIIRGCPFARRRLAVISETQRGCWLLLRGYQPWRPQRLQQILRESLPDDAAAPAMDDSGDCQSSLLADLSYLQLPPGLCASNSSSWLLTTLAQGLLRDLAWRLPGFAHSSLQHIRDNFLTLEARLDIEPERWLVKLGRPALNVVLAMTGLARGSHRLAWLDDQRVELYQGE